ncbi:hypothetical protein LTR16_001115 [Cryomyces antarcticus]|uniref:Uncharacterized protein n=1 Tax=Cryomyces antarcticus TaxID=329879 RepID=A0ABR0KUA9_9PEZI|nr:hypothetical protein LTR16_001115 [Cryomyces antarcticus]
MAYNQYACQQRPHQPHANQRPLQQIQGVERQQYASNEYNDSYVQSPGQIEQGYGQNAYEGYDSYEAHEQNEYNGYSDYSNGSSLGNSQLLGYARQNGQRPRPPQTQNMRGGYGELNPQQRRPGPPNREYSAENGQQRRSPPRAPQQMAAESNGHYRSQAQNTGPQTEHDGATQTKQPHMYENGAPQSQAPTQQYAQPLHSSVYQQAVQSPRPPRSPQPPKPEVAKFARKPLIAPESPKSLSFDNPFPIFPIKKKASSKPTTPVDPKMAALSIRSNRSSEEQGRPLTTNNQRSDPPQHRVNATNTEQDPRMHRQQSPPPVRQNNYSQGTNHEERPTQLTNQSTVQRTLRSPHQQVQQPAHPQTPFQPQQTQHPNVGHSPHFRAPQLNTQGSSLPQAMQRAPRPEYSSGPSDNLGNPVSANHSQSRSAIEQHHNVSREQPPFQQSSHRPGLPESSYSQDRIYDALQPPRAASSDHESGAVLQRARTLPQDYTAPPSQRQAAPPIDPRSYWQEPGPMAGHRRPEGRGFVPPRVPTASSTRSAPAAYPQPKGYPDTGHGALPGDPLPTQWINLQMNLGNSGQLYDTYRDREAEIEASMPQFSPGLPPEPDAQHQPAYGRQPGVNTAWIGSPPIQVRAHSMDTQQPMVVAPDFQNEGNHRQTQTNSSQHNYREHEQVNEGQSNGFVFEMPGDAPVQVLPELPAYDRATLRQHGPTGYGLPELPYTDANTRAKDRMPSRLLDISQKSSNSQRPFPPQQPGPQNRQMQGPDPSSQPHHAQRNIPTQSRDPSWATGARPQGRPPPVQTGSAVHPPVSAPGSLGLSTMQRPGPAANSNPPRRNSDALPQHPTPVRAGLLEPSPPPQPAKPPPVRQYNTSAAPDPSSQPQLPGPRHSLDSCGSSPVTHAEIERLKQAVQNNPADNKTSLLLAKKLVEAAKVLAPTTSADPKAVAKNRERYIYEAHKRVKKLASNGYPDAMFYLADAFGQGLLGLEVDTKEAFVLYQAAAKAGHAPSAYRTAVCCEMGPEEGGGTRKDPQKAVQWYTRAASLGDPPAMYKIGMIQLKGLLGQPRNLSVAVSWLKRAAERADAENPHALHELGLLYSSPPPHSGPEKDQIVVDEKEANRLFHEAANLGYKFSQFQLGHAYEYGLLGCPINARSSIGWYSKAAAQGEHQSELALSGWYLTGSEGVLEHSDTEAYLWARKAASAEGSGQAAGKAMFAMGYFTEVGIGCRADLNEAKRWYGRAAAYKFPKAQERLEELKKGGHKVQRGREKLSRSNQKKNDAECTVM